MKGNRSRDSLRGQRAIPIGDETHCRRAVFMVGFLFFLTTATGCESLRSRYYYNPKTEAGIACKSNCRNIYSSCRDDALAECSGGTKYNCAPSSLAARSLINDCRREEASCLEVCARRGRPAKKETFDEAESGPKPTSSARDSACVGRQVCLDDRGCLSGQVCGEAVRRCISKSCVAKLSAPVVSRTIQTSQAVAVRIASPSPETEEDVNSEQPNLTAEPDKAAGNATTNDVESEAEASSNSARTFSVDEAANLCGVEDDVVRGWIDAGKLKAIKVGGAYRISRSELATTWRELGGGELFHD